MVGEEGVEVPTTLSLTFPLGRYHATPWDRHVNEGDVEIPPSPWRLLRTLYAVWKTRCPDLPADIVEPLLAELAAPPTYYVPAHSIAHSRHWYPDANDGTDRTLDAFAVFGPDDQLAVQWPVDLSPAQRDALARIARSIPYFGRADSICVGSLDNNWAPTGHAVWKPLDVAEHIEHYTETKSVLAPQMPLIIDTLLAKPAEVRRSGLKFPSGSRLVAYGLEHRADTPLRRRQLRPTRIVTAVRFDLLHAALPPATDTAVYTDLLRQAAIKQLGEHPEGTMLGGKTSDGAPMQGGKHAHYLPLISERRLTGFVVWIPGGLDEKEQDALCAVRTLYDYKHRIQVRVSGIGAVDKIASELVGPATVWHTVTPFTPSRFPKKGRDVWADFVVEEIQRELRLRDYGPANAVDLVDGPWTSFVRHRPSARLRTDRQQGQAHLPAQFITLRFNEPVTGPLALGRLSHFGLGLFAPQR